MATLIRLSSCCGVYDLGNFQRLGLGDKENTVQDVINNIYIQVMENNDRKPFIIFADYLRYSGLIKTTVKSIGRDIKVFIEENNLGIVHQTVEKMNRNSNNNMEVFIWTVDWDNMAKYCSAAYKKHKEVVEERRQKQLKEREEARRRELEEIARAEEEANRRKQEIFYKSDWTPAENDYVSRTGEFQEFRRRPEVRNRSRASQRVMFRQYLQAQNSIPVSVSATTAIPF